MEVRCPGVIPFHLCLADCLIRIMLTQFVSHVVFYRWTQVHLVRALSWPQVTWMWVVLLKMSSPAPGQSVLIWRGNSWFKMVLDVFIQMSLVQRRTRGSEKEKIFLGILSASLWLISTQLPLVSPTAQPVPVLTSLRCCRDDQCHLLTATNPATVHSMLGAGI